MLSCCSPAASGRGQCRTCNGCDGGVPYEALYYAAAGIQLTERSYPYLSATYFYGQDTTCNGTRLTAPDRMGVRSWGPPLAARANNETALIAITSYSPTIVGFYAEDQFQLYAGGVFEPENCTGRSRSRAGFGLGSSERNRSACWSWRANHASASPTPHSLR
jgi:hypothetical protein